MMAICLNAHRGYQASLIDGNLRCNLELAS